MSETEWMATTDANAMLCYLWDKVSERSMRLFECACCRRVWQELTDERSRLAVKSAEDYADGLLTESELEVIANEANKAWPHDEKQFHHDGKLHVSAAAYNVAIPMGWWGGAPAFESPSSIIQKAAENSSLEMEAQAALLREIFGNPFRKVSEPKKWLSKNVVSISNKIYESQNFSAMPILGKALIDEGCNNSDILNHCYSQNPHVRGCWVIDLLLNKNANLNWKLDQA